MRKNIVAGNWKMNTTVPEGVQLAKDVCAAVHVDDKPSSQCEPIDAWLHYCADNLPASKELLRQSV